MSLSKSEFKMALDGMRQQLSNKICPKCKNGRPNIFDDEKLKHKYYIMCSYCSFKWECINEFISDDKQLRNLSHIKNEIIKTERIKIKNNIGSALHKNLNKIISKGSSLIIKKGNRYTIEVAAENRFFLNNSDALIIGKVKLCGRAELLLLSKIAILCEEKGKEVSWSIPLKKENLTVRLIRYRTEKCVISELSELCLLNIRAVLKSLINKGLVTCCEKSNFIDIHPAVIKNKDLIIKLLEYQDIPDEQKYKVFSHYKFKCVHCGEDKRSLNIAYISKDKSDPQSMIPICTFCYDSVTEDEILIDGTVTIFETKDSLVSWQFIVFFFPKIDNDVQAYQFNYILSLKYNEHDLIKAIAITLDKVSKGTKLFKIGSGATFFYKYVEKILENQDIKISNEIRSKYNLDYWLKVI